LQILTQSFFKIYRARIFHSKNVFKVFMPQRTSTRGAGQHFGICMLGVVVLLALLMWYFKGHQDSKPLPQRSPDVSHPG
jgi:hypothetical protein